MAASRQEAINIMITKPHIWLIVSAGTIVVSLLIIFLVQPQWGIDFTGGSLLEISAPGADAEAIRTALESVLDNSVTVQASQEGRFLIRTVPLTEDQHQVALEALGEADLLEEQLRFESIGPTIGEELRRKAITAIIIVVIALIGYLAYTFRQASGVVSSWKFGLAAVYALIHDLLFVLAVFVLLGAWYGVKIDTLFVTAMLALLGYSVNDTIVIFNRLKSEWGASTGGLLETLDDAVRHSLIRSLNTSLTTLLVLTALLLVGGQTIRWFVVALLIGTIIGTYSS